MGTKGKGKDGIDLSTVFHMINAAEPVDSNSIDSFYETFLPYGLPKDVIYPTYGLAECCVFVCSGGKLRIKANKQIMEEEKRIELLLTDEVDNNSSINDDNK